MRHRSLHGHKVQPALSLAPVSLILLPLLLLTNRAEV